MNKAIQDQQSSLKKNRLKNKKLTKESNENLKTEPDLPIITQKTLPSLGEQFQTPNKMAPLLFLKDHFLLSTNRSSKSSPNSNFTPLTTLVKTHTTWHNFAKVHNEQENQILMTQRTLEFNKMQQLKFEQCMLDNQEKSFSELSLQYSAERLRFKHNKVRIKYHDFFANIHKKPEFENYGLTPIKQQSQSQQQQQRSSQQQQKSTISTSTNNMNQTQKVSISNNLDLNNKRNNSASNINPLSLQSQNNQENRDEVNDDIPQQIYSQSNISMKFYIYSINEDSIKPEIREGATITQFSDQLILYGGLGSEIFQNIWMMSLKNFKWKKLQNKIESAPNFGRFGHTANKYKKSIIYFGGEKQYNQHLKIRDLLNDIKIFNPNTIDFSSIRLFGDIIENRKNHTCNIVGRYYFIFGGMNPYGKYLNDLIAINLETNKSAIMNFDRDDQQPGLAFHTAAAIYRGDDIKMDNPYYPFVVKTTKDKRRNVRIEGIYIFGGRLQNGESINKLRIIKLGVKPLTFLDPETKGVPPSPRYQHSMNYYQEMNILIICGGKYYSHKQGQGILSDIFVLHLENLCWVNIEIFGLEKISRASHATEIIDSKIFIFGGYQTEYFANADIIIIELDQNKSRMMLSMERSILAGKTKLSLNDMANTGRKDIYTLDVIHLANEMKQEQQNLQTQKKGNVEQLENSFINKSKMGDEHKFEGVKSYMPVPHLNQQIPRLTLVDRQLKKQKIIFNSLIVTFLKRFIVKYLNLDNKKLLSLEEQ